MWEAASVQCTRILMIPFHCCRVLCTQLSNDVTRRLLVLTPQERNVSFFFLFFPLTTVFPHYAKIQQAIGPHEDLLTIVKRRKLQWYGHVCSSSSLAKTILPGTVKGGRRQGRQRKRWDDNIRGYCHSSAKNIQHPGRHLIALLSAL